ncbi:MAG: crotonase/enoyl-CoA hydratase family protein [Acidimicrobiales bacterium]
MADDTDVPDDIRIVRIGRPERRNAVDSATADRLHDEFVTFDGDAGAKVAILTGDDDAFCAGADLTDLPKLRDSGPMGPTRLALSKPVIAAVEGWCVAGGLELAAWCDLRVAGETARFGCLERRWGVPLIDGGTVRLPLIVGLGRALDLILTGREVDATEAERIGLVNRVVPAGTALDAAIGLAQGIATSPWPAVVHDRLSAYESAGLSPAEALANEDRHGREVIFDPDFADGVAGFLANQGRRSESGER